MSHSVLYVSMSLDGFITGPDDHAGQGLGRGGERLHDWLGEGSDPSHFRPTGPSGEIFDESMATGSVRAGVLDELEVHLIPVLLGAGRRLFGELAAPTDLELIRVVDAPGVTHLRFRVKA